MLYFLITLFSFAIFLSFIKFLPYNTFDLLFTGLYMVLISYVSNYIFSKIFNIRPNFESQLITGFILALIVGPTSLIKNILFLSFIPTIAMASKYLIAYKKQHILNPAAFAVTLSAVLLNQGASWWAGGASMLVFVVLGGLLMLRKLKRFHLVISFLLSYSLLLSLFNIYTQGISILPDLLKGAFLSPSLLFFTFIMLTEPITSPANKKFRIYFGIFCGILYATASTYLTIFYSLELSLLCTNLVFRIVSFSEKYSLILQEKKEIAKGIWEFIFEPTKKFAFTPGQYLEWSLPHPHPDSRGERRYFTISSSPTEKDLKLTVKIPKKSSSYKKALLDLKSGESIYATNLEGEFVLSEDSSQKYVFIAGGIGVTPYISIIKYALDKYRKINATLFYIARDESEFTYKELLTKAEKKLGVKVVYVISENPPANWNGETGRLNEEIIKKYIKEIELPIYYISGPQPMVMAYEELLQKIGHGKIKYKADFFPGYEETYSK